MVIDREDNVVKLRDQARKAGTFTIRFADGEIFASLGVRQGPRRSSKILLEAKQNELF